MAKGRIAKVKTVLVTGSGGLIGSEAVGHFDRQGHHVIGVDNNMRRMFFGPPGDTTWILERLKSVSSNFLRSEEHTSELQSLAYLVCRLLLEKKKTIQCVLLHYSMYDLTYAVQTTIDSY